ncbi:disulfide bond formation protein DsbB [Shimia isoporae]|uniref:Disulfide bond formation protein DsbB n=1 Tax=Shimia isoporae TaxID=647720 RepID=A0A4R1NMQ7_9RHOB|nr:disulfide bond formation protein B [Shimia isoporae]TCL09614.1 disulfide bond formation protein DsbB [Shimia isoporae]
MKYLDLLSQKQWVGLLTAFSVFMVLGAWGFEFIGNLPPCQLCYYQRYPHWVAAGAGVLAIFVGGQIWLYLGALGAAASGFVAAFHTGVERGWWDGPASCSGGMALDKVSTDDLFDQIMSAPLVRCDEIPWELFGLSMANYNMLMSLTAAVLWIYAARRSS